MATIGNSTDFSMAYSAMVELATEVETIYDEFDTMRAGLESLATEMEDAWQGKAQKEFVAA